MPFFYRQFIPAGMRCIIRSIGRNQAKRPIFKLFAFSRTHAPQIFLTAIELIGIIDIVGTYNIHIAYCILKRLFGTAAQKFPHFFIRHSRCCCNLQLYLIGNKLGHILGMNQLRIDNRPLILRYAVKILRLMFSRQPVNGHHADRAHPQSQYQHKGHTHGQYLKFY